MSKSCLIVDDVEVTQYVLGELMEAYGFTITNARNAIETLTSLESQPFDIILLDWHLRKKSGLELVPDIRSRRNGQNVPIIVCTGVELDKELHDINSSDVQGLLKKPISHDALKDVLKKLNLI